MLLLFFAILTALGLFGVVAFLLGFRIGGEHWQSELARVRLESAQAERQLHQLTREAFEAMARAVERQRHQHPES